MRGRTLEAFLMALALLVPVAAEAGWHDEASSFDQNRLARLDESRAKGLAEAHGRGTGDAEAIHETLDRPAVSGGSLAGAWHCRTIKLGGMTPFVVYSWHRCRIAEYRGGLAFEKLDGTQRMAGQLHAEGGSYVYLGASWVKGETPHRYSGSGASAGASATPDDQIGLLSSTGGGTARLELPYPVQESSFDVVELRR